MRSFAASVLAGLIVVLAAGEVAAYPLTLEQRERLKEYLPRTFPKLEGREPVHVVALGDDVMGGYTPLPSAWESNNPLFSYPGVFLGLVAREFFYPGSVRLLNPPAGGSAKRTDRLGDEITFENLTTIDGTVLDGLRHAHTDAFLHEPDLVLVQFGIYDAFGFIGIDTYKRALQEIVDAGKNYRSDLILFGPPMVNYGGGAMEWGIERPYATAAKEVAMANGVLFIDLGRHLSRFGGGVDRDTHPAAAMEIIGDKLERTFYFGPELTVRERVHPSLKVHEFLGESAFADLKDGPPLSSFTYTGAANYGTDGSIGVSVVLRNQSEASKEGTMGGLAVGGAMLPGEAGQRYTVPAGTATQLEFRYTRPNVGKSRDGSPLFFPLEPADEFGRFAFFLEDTIGSEIVDLPVRIGPVTAMWKTRQFVNVDKQMRVEWDLVNGLDKAVSGTFQVGMADRVGQPTPFSVSPLGNKTVFSLFEFIAPEGVSLFQQDLWIQLEAEGKVVRFSREMESSRDLVLGEEMPLRAWKDYANLTPAVESVAQRRPSAAPSVRFDADEKALYVVAKLDGLELPDLGDQAALQAKLFIDARPGSEVRNFGVVEPVYIYTRATDGPGFTPSVELGSFGNGYNMILSPKGIQSALRTDGDGSRLLEMRIPRAYFHRNEWALESPEAMLGVRLELTVADPTPGAAQPFPAVNRYETNSPTFAYEDRMIRGFHENDARSLITLRLSRQPVQSWSVRVY
ncbi:MAG: SGNH/GDSL hydrolase family protein [Verrucomicrobiales bacterium]|nr:SGNH/GDSL hydrolase family protein [Verrucomicrobiales bacterium]